MRIKYLRISRKGLIHVDLRHVRHCADEYKQLNKFIYPSFCDLEDKFIRFTLRAMRS